jgi:hypothetical protein
MVTNSKLEEGGRGRPRSFDSNLAVLIDAENTPRDMIKFILDETASHGRAIIKRAYGDWTTPQLNGWNAIFREHAIKPMQQYRFTTGKNSSDSAMIIDAMDILHEGKVDTFVLVTSDSDFTGLATRIREEGLTVIGVGRKTAPQSFVKGCEEFVLIENLSNSSTAIPDHLRNKSTRGAGGQVPDKMDSQLAPARSEKDSAKLEQSSADDGKSLLERAARAAADDEGIIAGAKLAAVLRRLDPSFMPKNYGVKKLADFIDRYPEILTLVGKRSGTDPRYKLVQ